MSIKNLPLISVITVTFNCEDTIEKTILSIINQSYPNKEFIVIDGKSTDNTIKIINKFSKAINKIVIEPDKGIYDAMNKGIDLATGRWINFMNAGDTFSDINVLEKVFRNLSISNKCGVVYGDTIFSSDVGKFLFVSNSPFFKSTDRIKSKGICHQSIFFRLDVVKKIKYNLKYSIAADFDMLYKIHNCNYEFFYVPIPVAIYLIDNGISKEKPIRAWVENANILGIKEKKIFKIWLIKYSIKFILKKMILNIVKHTNKNLYIKIKCLSLQKLQRIE